MGKVFYFLLTFLESGLAVFGIRSPLEQPPYAVVGKIGDAIEIRSYGALAAVETEGNEDAFSRLFRYIAGANAGRRLIAMTAPVTQIGGPHGSPSEASTGRATMMRFILPRSIADAPPLPEDPRVRVVIVPAHTAAVIRFSGRLSQESLASHRETLRAALARADRLTEGAPYFMGYDPPFTIPALRRNEVAIDLKS